jgi:RHS protein
LPVALEKQQALFDCPIAKLTAAGAFNMLADQLGTPLALYDQGEATWQAELDAYGAGASPRTAPSATPASTRT